jgi:hypothetical protein
MSSASSRWRGVLQEEAVHPNLWRCAVGAILLWSGLILVGMGVIDRVLLGMEACGWINYRRNGLSRGAALYHTFELQSVFDPGIRYVQEIQYEKRKAEDDIGAPPGPTPEVERRRP